MSAINILGMGRLTQWLSRTRSANQLMQDYAKSGDEASFTALYQQYSERVYYFILVMCDAELAADICQKTWIKVVENRHRYRDQHNAQAWLFTLARRTLIDECRKQNRFLVDSETTELEANKAVKKERNNEQREQQFHQALSTLPFKQKEALSLQMDGFSINDIAAICSSNSETIKTRLRYAKDNLRKQMEVCGEN